MDVVFFGTPGFAVPFLKALVDENSINVNAVVTQPDRPSGRGQDLKPTPVNRFAREQKIPVLTPERLAEIGDRLSQYEADVFVVVAYGNLIPKSILSIPPHGCINVHPSLLPKYRGPAPMQAAIANGDDVTGITIMKLDAGMDTGPILDQMTIQIEPDETYPHLRKKVEKMGPPLLIKTATDYIAGDIEPVPQNASGASTTSLLNKEDGRVDWNASAKTIDQKHRAYQPWPGSWTIWQHENETQRFNLELKMTDREAVDQPGTVHIENGRLFIDCGNGQVEILRIQPNGKKPMPADAFIRGYPTIENAVLS